MYLQGLQAVKPGAALAALRGKHWHYCAEPTCGKRFSGIKTAKFCSNACRQRAKYAKSKRPFDAGGRQE